MPEDLMRILRLELRTDEDVVAARQRARLISAELAFERQDQVRVATALSEVAREAVTSGGGGQIEFFVRGERPSLVMRLTSRRSPAPARGDASRRGEGCAPAPGIDSASGLMAARRLCDEFESTQSPDGTRILTLARWLPAKSRMTRARLVALVETLSGQPGPDTLEELARQNKDLLEALEDLRARQEELARLNLELEETNKGVVALYAELDDKAASLEKANATRTRFFANMTHEFRTPLNSIRSLVEMLLARVDGDLNTEQERQVGFVRKSVVELSDMVDDLLDLAKAEAGCATVRKEEFAVDDLLSALRGMFRPIAASAPAVTLAIEDAPPGARMVSDEGKIGQILRNLLSNAMKFTPAGEVRLTVRRLEDRHILFTVSDTGVGIAPEHMEAVFEEFVQVEGGARGAAKGTGLGLPLARRLATLLGGALVAESDLGSGSTFSCVLPVGEVDALGRAGEVATAARIGDSARVGATAGGASGGNEATRASATGRLEFASAFPEDAEATRPRALLVDDDAVARYLLGEVLKAEGFAVLEARCGEEGVRVARDRRPHVIFLDLVMPGAGGLATLDVLRSDPLTRDIPVVIHSSDDDDARVADAKSHGADAFLSKTGESPQSRREAVRAALRHRDAPREGT